MRDLGHPSRLVLLAGALAIVGCNSAPADGVESWRTLTSERQLSDEDDLDVQIEYAVGRLEISPAEASTLYHMDIRYDEEHFAPIAEYDRGAAALRLGIEALGQNNTVTDLSDESRASIQLAPSVPLDLELEFGAGEAELDLGGLALRSLDVSTGASATGIRFDEPNRIPAEWVSINAGAASLRVANLGNARAERIDFSGGVGETTLDFGGAWERSSSVSVKMGIGALTLRLPRDVGVQMNRKSVLTAFDAGGLTRRGDAYFSGNWGTAPHRLTIDVDAAFGAIDVEWID